jgi:hypothetical protein
MAGWLRELGLAAPAVGNCGRADDGSFGLSYPKISESAKGRCMELGFETIGNATLVCHDNGPVLVTDPWTTGTAFFGSWGLSHAIPDEVMASIKACRYAWVSHGHPDHMSHRSLDSLSHAEILLPNHVNGLIREGLTERGLKVRVLEDCQWTQLSEHIRVMSIADYIQDAILLVDLGGRLIVNLNDADDNGWGPFVKRIIRSYDVSFMLHLSGFGDTDMINFYREDGTFIEPRAARKRPVGRSMANWARQWGTRFTAPFSSMHIYQRSDSIWADQYKTHLADYSVGWDQAAGELLPAFVRYDAIKNSFAEINPEPNREAPLDPAHFGDNWAEPLEPEDRGKIDRYFKSFSHLPTFLDFIRVRVGGVEHFVELSPHKKFNRGLTFDAPRHSFMTSIEYEIFDDVLIGNFMKVTLHGKFPARPLYPDFIPYVTKYGDNGRAKSAQELQEYFNAYRNRYPLGYLRHCFEKRAVEAIRYSIEEDGSVYKACARTYHWMKSLRPPAKTRSFKLDFRPDGTISK